MSGIGIRDFSRAALLDQDGEIRLAKGTTNELVNKGTVGNRIASIFQNAFQAIGLMDRTQDRIDRQLQALDSFRQALTSHYGEEGANLALQMTGLDQDGARLTGRSIKRAMELAAQTVRETRLELGQSMKLYAPPFGDQEPGVRFVALLNLPGAKQLASEEDQQEYWSRFVRAVDAESGGGTKALTDDEISKIARTTLNQVATLSEEGRLDQAKEAQARFVSSVKDVLRSLVDGGNPDQLMARLGTAIARASEQLSAEMTGEVGGSDVKDLLERGFLEAFRDFPPEYRGLLVKAQQNALAEDSPLRAIFAAAQDHMFDEQPRNGPASSAVMGFSTSLISALSKEVGSLTGSGTGDLRVLGDDGTVPSRLKERAEGAMQRHLDRVNNDGIAVGKQCLDQIREQFDGYVEDPHSPSLIAKWHSPKVLDKLEHDLFKHMNTAGIDFKTAVDDFRRAIGSDETLHPALKDKLRFALDGIVAESALHDSLVEMPEFKGLRQQDVWQIFAGGRRVSEGSTKWDLEHYGQGSLAGSQRAFDKMLRDYHENVPLTAEYLQSLHIEGTRETWNEQLGDSFRESFLEDLDTRDVWVEDCRVPQGFRSGDQVTLHLRTREVTDQGRNQIENLHENDPWFSKCTSEDDRVSIRYTDVTPQQSNDRAEAILSTYQEQIAQAETDDEKRQVIAQTIQDLYRSHIFQDGNTRTTVVTLMNRMLLDNGLSPCILSDPKAAAGYSREEFAQAILEGQLAYQHLTLEPEDKIGV